MLSVMLSAAGCQTLLLLAADSASPTPSPTIAATSTPEPTATPAPTEDPIVEALPTATPEPEKVEITEDNYKLLFAPAPGYDYVGLAYMKAPAGYGSFVDAYVPYTESLVYRDDGYAVLASAHGITVLERIYEGGATAEETMEDLAAYYEELLDQSGDGERAFGEIQFYAEYDIAVQQARSYSGDGQYVHDAILYSDTRGDGYYFQAIILYLPERFDSETNALIDELSSIFGMTMPKAE